jgi:hypothetical protein
MPKVAHNKTPLSLPDFVTVYGQGGVSLNDLTEVPVIFLAFAMGETASPERSIGECGGGKTSPKARASENKGLNVEVKRNVPCP